ncbi:MAG: preprotein translocase subunit SecG [Candidatus Parcubacteria bacterium]|nr:preprotein translocase subunit SecG [Candidatus Parcubacteria bacterium]
MPLPQIISVFQIIICVLIAIAILFQQRGSGVGGAFGGAGASYFTRRGLEKILFIATIILGILFVASTIASLLIK